MSNDSLMDPTFLAKQISLLEKDLTPLEIAQFNTQNAVQYALAIIETSSIPPEKMDIVRATLLAANENMNEAVRQEKSFLKMLKSLREDRRWSIANKLPKFLKK